MKPFPRIPLSLLCMVMAAVLSYTLQRLVDAQNEPPMGTVLLQATIPYYWRVGMSVLHACAVGLLVYTLFPRVTWSMRVMLAGISCVFLVCIVSLIAVP